MLNASLLNRGHETLNNVDAALPDEQCLLFNLETLRAKESLSQSSKTNHGTTLIAFSGNFPHI